MRKKLILIPLLIAALMGALYVAASRVLGSGLVRARLEQQLSVRLGQPVRIGSASAAVFPRVAVDLHDVTVGAPAAITLGRIRIVTGLRALLSRTIQDAEVILDDGELRLPLPFDLFPATPVAVTAAAASALTVASIRVIALRRLTLIAGDQKWLTEADGTIEGDRLEVTRVSAESNVTRLHGSGAIASMVRSEGQFSVAADPLDLGELIAFGSAFARPAAAAPATATAKSPMHVRVVLTAPSGRFAIHQFRDLAATVDLTDGALSLSPFAVSALGGRFQGRLDADTRKALPLLRLTGRIDGLDVVEVMKAAGSEGGITGRLGGSLSVSGTGTDSEVLLRSARGSMTAAITDGTMPRLELVRPIVLAFGRPSGAPPQGSGSAFSRLGGTFALAGGVVDSSDISMASRDFDLNGRGRVELASGALSARGDVALSSELTAQAGTDLRRYAQQDGRVVVPATIGGTLQQPTVALDVAAATRRALGNEIQRRTKSLLDGLFRRREK
jgi:uncharacterized protein involved in outer membrane biogenesis